MKRKECAPTDPNLISIAIVVTITGTLHTFSLLNCPHPLFTMVASNDDSEKTPKELGICSCGQGTQVTLLSFNHVLFLSLRSHGMQ